MKCVVQRVSEASLTVDEKPVGSIDGGLVVLAGFSDSDTQEQLDWMARKIMGLRVFADEDGNQNLALEETGGSVVIVPNFTLYGDCRKGRRPSFTRAGDPATSSPLYDQFVELIQFSGIPTVAGVFGSSMQVSLVNDGPITLIIEREANA